jgi:hypothetical protein
MTCERLRELLDRQSIREWPPRLSSVARRHGDHCRECRAVLDGAQLLDARLARLPDPVLPAGLAPAIMARTTRLAEQGFRPPRQTPSPMRPARDTMRSWRDALVWCAPLAGTTIGVGTVLYRSLGARLTGGALPPLDGGGGGAHVEVPLEVATTFFVAVGLLLYVVGFLAPLVRDARETQPPR